ncbi:probable calcium-binding protein CML44 isoform X1 [Vigna unguiculata]|uniref:Calcium-binding protein CML n=2 Tax=Vigna unguiculata TaxID=3917 RepID=A0A4D6NQR0_VIGUN|nr:probable calcium-binding protein CML44 isoform X1 [Vigna unguiculata]QCE15718.1 calcium-binding protein CML [Vigna unguiculata]
MCLLTQSDLKRIFEKVDVNGDGLVSLEELNQMLQITGNCNYTIQELESLVETKSLGLSEFLFFYNSISEQQNGEIRGGGGEAEELESDLVKTFKVFDLDGDGFITSHELESVLKRLGMWDETNCNDSTTMIRFYDTNFDGRLDFQEFKNMMLVSRA